MNIYLLQTLLFLYLRAKRRYLTWIFWILVWAITGVFFAFIFNSVKPEADKYKELIQTLPPQIANSFNIANDYLGKPETFLSGQFLTIFCLAGSVFALIMGIGEMGGKIADKTISLWLTKNISRVQLYAYQALANTIFIVTSNALIWLSLYTSFLLISKPDNLSTDYFMYGSIGSTLLFLAWAYVGQLSGVIFSKTIAQNGGIAIIILSWFINSLSTIEGFPSWTRPFSLFYFFDNVKLRDEFTLNTDRIWVLAVVIIVSFGLGAFHFRRRDIPV